MASAVWARRRGSDHVLTSFPTHLSLHPPRPHLPTPVPDLGKSVQKSWKLNPWLPSTLASGRVVEKASAGREKGQETETQVLEPIL